MASNYPLGYDDERFQSIVNQNFHCLICYNVLKDPVMCRKNEHHFCRGCITEHLRRNSHTCPTCADELSVETLQDVPRFVRNYLNELSIRCDHYDRGCRELVQLQNLKRHVAECRFTPVVCGNQGCGETISKRDGTYHESEQCKFRKLKCHNCGEISTIMAGMEKEVANLNTKMANINTNHANTNTNLTNIRTEIADVKTEMENINTNQAEMQTKLANMNTNMGNIKTEIADVKTEMAKTDTKVENLNTKMTNLHANVEVKFEAMNNEVRGMKMSLNEVKDGFDHLKEASGGRRENQHIFVAGGARRNSVEIFNNRQKLWSLLKSMPGNRNSASSFVYNNHVTVAGGWCAAALDNMFRMNIHPVPDLPITWSDFAAKLPAKMCGHSSVVYKDSLLVTGGYDEDQDVYSDCIHEVRLKPPYTVKLVSKMPEPRVHHSTVLCDDSILIVGGRKSGNCKDNLSSVLSYDIKKNECQQLPALPYPVSQMATVKWAENVVIIGGADKDHGKALNNVTIYNIKTGNSYMLPPMLHKRRGCMAVVIENTIVVLGGEDEKWNVLKSVEGFNFERFSWQELPDMKEDRYLGTAVVI
ncbi:E3 ubiquitin- ligase NRDP1 [Paramuricea clavata]|uniref:E3 ubiquitin- ligase NRDP1 n=1 Tax=Paramuricea clavata TaxID=317549 RepID=A0A6S7LT24_PARCT|nr:E3 ubiquitin- ligase NRDP1 [Paramuricea clavata]